MKHTAIEILGALIFALLFMSLGALAVVISEVLR